jgi:hypothetical protein
MTFSRKHNIKKLNEQIVKLDINKNDIVEKEEANQIIKNISMKKRQDKNLIATNSAKGMIGENERPVETKKVDMFKIAREKKIPFINTVSLASKQKKAYSQNDLIFKS